MKIMKKINTLNSVIQTTEGRKNLGITQSMLPRSFAPLWMTVMMVLAFTACSEEDLVQPTNGEAGSLRIASVIIDGQEVGRSRVVGEGLDAPYNKYDLPYNHSITGFSEGDKMELIVGFTGTNQSTTTTFSKAVYGNGTWSIEKQHKPDPTKNNEYWEGVYIKAAISCVAVGGKSESERNKYQQVAQTMGIVQGDIPEYVKKEDVKEYHYSLMVGDALAASTLSNEQIYNGYGSITVDTDLNSPTLGAATIVLKHTDRSLLRLPKTEDAFRVTAGDYIVNGKCINVTSLASLWAVFYDSYPDSDGYRDYQYIPFTEVTIGGQDYLQAIVSPGGIDFVGFKAVMCTNESGKTHTLDLPFKVGGAASNKYRFASHTQYPMTLNISPNSAAVTFTTPEGKPGWAVDVTETELDNSKNDIDLVYNDNCEFDVYSAKGLMLLNQWITNSIDNNKLKNGCVFVDKYNQLENGQFHLNNKRLAVNINLKKNITLPANYQWIPIGDLNYAYGGTFRGNNKTIRNLTIDSNKEAVGLFGAMYRGNVLNLKLENANVKGKSKVGAILGAVKDPITIINCVVDGTVRGTSQEYNGIGGIVGHAGSSNINLIGCVNNANIEVTGTQGYVGGVIGFSWYDNSYCIACSNTGIITITNESEYTPTVGGVVGYMSSPYVYGCWSINTFSHKGMSKELKVVGNKSENLEGCFIVTNDDNGKTEINSKAENMNGVISRKTPPFLEKWNWVASTNGGWPKLVYAN